MARPTKFDEPMSESIYFRLTPQMKQDIEQAAKQAAEAAGIPDQESFAKIWRDAIVNSAQEMVMTGSNQILIDFEDGTAQAIPEDDQPSKAYKVDTSNVKSQKVGKSVTEKMLEDQESVDSAG